MLIPSLMRGATVLAMMGVFAAAPAGAQGPALGEEIGSLRNARIAYPMADARLPLTYLAGRLSAEQAAELAEIAPNVRIVTAADREEAMAHAGEVQGTDGRFVTAAFLARAPELVWVQCPSAGVEWLVGIEGMADDRIVLTNMRAVHGPAIADHAMAMLLTLTRNMREHGKNQSLEEWSQAEAATRPVALAERTMLVVGIGGIGGEIAKRAHGFGMRVIATRRTDAPAPEFVERVGKPGDLMAMLPEADVVAVCVPLTAETEGMLGKGAFAAMKAGSYLINVARGRVVDTAALVEALETGHLAGACLDVTDPEPLPPGHALWRMANVVITPHVSSDAAETDERRWALLKENIRRFGAGEPLLNVVDKAAGY
jgi:phosphoglycerate dehydrogenase-like enzyme